MFGRKLKKEYKLMEYCIVDKKSGEVVETRHMPIKDPVMAVVSGGFAFSLIIAVISNVLIIPLLGLTVSEHNAILLLGILFAIGASISYYFITERF